jgi:hypothetical protein
MGTTQAAVLADGTDLVVVFPSRLDDAAVNRWCSEPEAACFKGRFRQVFVYGAQQHKRGPWLNQLSGWLSNESGSNAVALIHGPGLEQPSWGVALLKHLQDLAGSSAQVHVLSRKATKSTIFIEAGEPWACVSELASLSGQEWLLSNRLHPGQNWLSLQALPSNVIRFEDYYELLSWRSLPPSNRVLALPTHVARVSTERAIAMPTTFYNRAIHAHCAIDQKTADAFLALMMPTLFSSFAPPPTE